MRTLQPCVFAALPPALLAQRDTRIEGVALLGALCIVIGSSRSTSLAWFDSSDVLRSPPLILAGTPLPYALGADVCLMAAHYHN